MKIEFAVHLVPLLHPGCTLETPGGFGSPADTQPRPPRSFDLSESSLGASKTQSGLRATAPVEYATALISVQLDRQSLDIKLSIKIRKPSAHQETKLAKLKDLQV